MDKDVLKTCFEALHLGDRSAFVRIYEEYKQPVYTIALRILKNTGSAEDVTQDFFLKLYASPPDSSVANYRAWIFAVVRNMAIDELRREKRRQGDELGEEETEDNDPALKLDVERAIANLSLEEREILTLHLNCSLGFSEISLITKKSLPSVYRRYRKALRSVREYLKEGTE